jgi:hypothetical protein
VWEKFTAVLKGGKIRGTECKYCKKYLSVKNKRGTSHLRRHLKICLARPATVRVQERQTSPYPDSSADRDSMSDQDRSLELLTKSLVSNLCSFSMASDMSFRQFLAGTCPSYGVVSQSSVREKLRSIFQNEKLKLMEQIALAPGGVFLALARWGCYGPAGSPPGGGAGPGGGAAPAADRLPPSDSYSSLGFSYL